MIVLIVGSYSAIAVLATAGMGAIVTQVRAMYPPEDQHRVNDLLTYPTLFMGIGNLLAMPLCVAIGRRPVFLMSLVILVAAFFLVPETMYDRVLEDDFGQSLTHLTPWMGNEIQLLTT